MSNMIEEEKNCQNSNVFPAVSRESVIAKYCLIDLGIRSNPFGDPFKHGELRACIQDIIGTIDRQKELSFIDTYLDFKKAAASFVDKGIGTEHILPLTGKYLIEIVAESFLEKDDEVIITTSSSFDIVLLLQEKGIKVNYQDIRFLAEITDRSLNTAKMVVISNPHFLSGALLPSDEVELLAKRCKDNGTLLFVDETLIELSDPYQSVASVVRENEYILIQRSISDTFALSEKQITFAITSHNLIGKLKPSIIENKEDLSSLILGTSLMNSGCNSKYIKKSREFIRKQRAYLVELFSKHGYVPEHSDSVHILVNLKLLMGLKELTQRLESHGVMLMDCSSFYSPGEDYVRVAVTTQDNIDRFEEIFGIVMGEWAKDYANEKLSDVMNRGSLSGSNTECPYYPCHFPGQDCTFCYCPFNPCKEEKTGGEWIIGSKGKKGWSCMNCYLIHKPEIAQAVLGILLQQDDLENSLGKAWSKVIKPVI
ncbi:aminotransferase class I/II-fold pyridoxal phosphate-dependent enzyme [uncultured Methanomethylovorans sp.]|uniref:aminotransferase class I/II-fold pyridoxal phosphate-dependent enzyme n=1 Tax=uncultured Methanomethylovorans sp. TaxID=183759 RepID=UPI00374A818E